MKIKIAVFFFGVAFLFLCKPGWTSNYTIQGQMMMHPGSKKPHKAKLKWPSGWYIQAGPHGGALHYYEGAVFPGVENFYGGITLPDVGYSAEIGYSPPKKGIWGAVRLSQSWTGRGNETYLTYSTFFPPGLQVNPPILSPAPPGDYYVQKNLQNSWYSAFYSDIYLGYKFPYGHHGESVILFALAGWRSMTINVNGGTFTVSQCSSTGCSAPMFSGVVVGNGTETHRSPDYGGGMQFDIPLANHWEITSRLQYATLPHALITAEYIPGTPVLASHGEEGVAQINIEKFINNNFAFSFGYTGDFFGIRRSPMDSLGYFYPGGGWNENNIHGQLIYHF